MVRVASSTDLSSVQEANCTHPLAVLVANSIDPSTIPKRPFNTTQMSQMTQK